MALCNRGRRGAVDREFCLIFSGFWAERVVPEARKKMVVACRGVDSQGLATILDPFRTIFVDLGPDGFSAT